MQIQTQEVIAFFVITLNIMLLIIGLHGHLF